MTGQNTRPRSESADTGPYVLPSCNTNHRADTASSHDSQSIYHRDAKRGSPAMFPTMGHSECRGTHAGQLSIAPRCVCTSALAPFRLPMKAIEDGATSPYASLHRPIMPFDPLAQVPDIGSISTLARLAASVKGKVKYRFVRPMGSSGRSRPYGAALHERSGHRKPDCCSTRSSRAQVRQER
jgi:hypothetical protein